MSNFTTPKYLMAASAILTVLTAASCSTETNGTPSATENTSTTSSANEPTTSGATPTVTAPSVSRPLKVDKFTTNPCLGLTATQLSDFGADAQGSPIDTGNGVGCKWKAGPDKLTAIATDFYPQITDGLSRIYQQNASGYFKEGYFEPTIVNSYPATFNNVSDNRKDGECSITVAVSDQAIFDALVLGKPGSDGCKAAGNVAQAVLETIKENQ